MSRASLPVLIGVAALLTALLGTEFALDAATPDLPMTGAALPGAVASPASDGAKPTQAWIATIRARPVFNPDRKPPPPLLPGANPTNAELPRLSGVLLTPDGGRAIFAAAAAGGRPIAVASGGHLGAYVVTRIDAEGVTISGPDGRRTLRPTFAAAAQSEAANVASGPRPGSSPTGLDLIRHPPNIPIPTRDPAAIAQ